MDILGWKFSMFTNDIQASQVGFLGIAVALLGRNTAVGVVCGGAAVRRAARPGRRSATSTRACSTRTWRQNLTYMIQGLIVLLVSTDVIALRVLRGGRGIAVGLRRRASPSGAPRRRAA